MHRSLAVVSASAVLALLGVAGAAQAQPAMVTARVLSSAPVWEPVPVSNCAPGAGAAAPSGAGAGIGALLGGLIGSQFGQGGGHAAGAVLGALGGAMFGHAAEAQQNGYAAGACTTRYENRLTGYDVSYEYAGQTYRTRMPSDPGAWVQVAAPAAQSYSVTPEPAMGAYPLSGAAPYPAPGVVAAPPAGYGTAYPQPVYAPPAYAAPVVVPRPVYGVPLGVSLSVGGGWGGHHRGGGWGVGIGSGW